DYIKKSIGGILLMMFSVSVLAQHEKSTEKIEMQGTWVGWLYYKLQCGDEPVKIWFPQDTTAASYLQIPSIQGLEFKLTVFDSGEDKLDMMFEQTIDKTTYKIVVTGDRQEDSFKGEIDVNGAVADVYLSRTNEYLKRDLGSVESFLGVYQVSGTDAILIEKWFWGELIYNDLTTGHRCTLFEKDSNTFIGGKRLYDLSE